MDVPYQSGGYAGLLNLPVMNSYNEVRQDDDRKLRFISEGRGRLVDFIDLLGERKYSDNMWYRQYERDRRHPKILATSPGGAANAAVTFTLNSAAVAGYDISQPDPPMSGTTPTTVNRVPVKVRDVLLMKPTTGVSAGTLIMAEVVSVNTGAGTFVARPRVAGQSLPVISTADEIVYLYNNLTDGGNLADPTYFTTSFYDNSMNAGSYRYRVSDSALHNARIYQVNGVAKAFSPGDLDEHLMEALDQRELMFMLGGRITNDALADIYNGTETPPVTGNGLIPEMQSRSNISTYSPITGPTYNWFRAMTLLLTKQRAGTEFMFFQGHSLRSDISKLNLNELNGGLINIGNFTYKDDKYVNLDFTGMMVDGIKYHMKTVESFSDVQTLGAAGFPFIHEGMIFPTKKVKNPKTGEEAAHVRMRYTTDVMGNDSTLAINKWNGFEQAENGNGKLEYRIKFAGGIELIGAQHTVYVQKGI
jgi:hypothetical protein